MDFTSTLSCMEENALPPDPSHTSSKSPKNLITRLSVKHPRLKQRKWQAIGVAVVVVLILLIAIGLHGSGHNTTRPGDTVGASCSTAGVKMGNGPGVTLICTQFDGKLVWQKQSGAVVGATCATAGAMIGAGKGISLICQESNGKLVWQSDVSGGNLGNADSLDPITKGKAMANGECTGSGSIQLTHAPLDAADIGTITPLGDMVGGHVTPVSHQYYYQANQNAAADTYPVYATANGTITGVAVNYHNGSSPLPAWYVVLSHSCTFFSEYNLMTSIAPNIKAALPKTWGPDNSGGVKIPVTAGEVIGYVGGQSLDFSVVNTQVTLKGYLFHTAYNNGDPTAINTVEPLDYFSPAVKAQTTPYYLRTVAPLDGKIDYDVKGEAVGGWFVVGSNGYAGGNTNNGTGTPWATHLALAYDFIDPTGLTFSIGDYKGDPNSPTQFAVSNAVDWTKITPSSGAVKVELSQPEYVTPSGSTWNGTLVHGVQYKAGPFEATALLQMTDALDMKVQVFPGKTASQVTGFTSAAVMYNRGQDAHMVQSTTASNSSSLTAN
jgi:hypothetical protein